MKYFILLFFLFSLTTGCNFLSGNKDSSLTEDSLADDEEYLDDTVMEEEFEEDAEEEMEFEAELEEDTEEEMEEEEGKPKKRGFFSWLFDGDSKKEETEEEALDSQFVGEDEDFLSEERAYEDYEEEEEEEDSPAETPTENLAAQDIIEQESTAPETAPETSANLEETEPLTKQSIPLNKIMTVPYMKAGQIVNAVYIARPEEDLSLISQKIYGRDETNQLLKINSHLQNRSVVVGDKVYYNSPNRPNDNIKLLFYYQDNNIPPSYYNLSPGDNIRTVATQILKHPKSWKEIWATNPNLKSKSIMEKNLDIVYWPESTAQTAPGFDTEQMEQPKTDETAEEPMPAVMDEKPSEETQIEEKIDQPIPNIPAKIETKKSQGILKELLNNMEIIVGIIVFLILLYLIIRIILNKRNQRDFDYTATNIEV